MRRPLRLLLVLAAPLLLGAAKPSLDAVVNAPLQSADPAKPIEIIASRAWLVTDSLGGETVEAVPQEFRVRRADRLDLGTFTVEPDKGPLSLVVDYGAALDALTGSSGSVRVGIECMNQPLACAIPANKTVLMFHGDLLSKIPVTVPGGRALFAMGRESQSYRLPAGETVRFDLELGTPRKLDPLLIKAWLIYGQNAREVVPGQTSQSTAIAWVIGGGILLIILIWRRLVRR